MIVAYICEDSKKNFTDKFKVHDDVFSCLFELNNKKNWLCKNSKCEKELEKFYINCVYERSYRDDNCKIKGFIAQIRCKNCGITHALIPNFLIPYKQFPAEVIEAQIAIKEAKECKQLQKINCGVSGNSNEVDGCNTQNCLIENIYENDCSADNSTINRWYAEHKRNAEEKKNKLKKLLLSLYKIQPNSIALHKKTILCQFRYILEKFEIQFNKNQLILPEVNRILTLYNNGFF